MEKKITLEDLEMAYDKCLASWNRAEQYEFPVLVVMENKINWGLSDLKKNWDEHHAEILMKLITKLTH